MAETCGRRKRNKQDLESKERKGNGSERGAYLGGTSHGRTRNLAQRPNRAQRTRENKKC
jgi:hypothetical protein